MRLQLTLPKITRTCNNEPVVVMIQVNGYLWNRSRSLRLKTYASPNICRKINGSQFKGGLLCHLTKCSKRKNTPQHDFDCNKRGCLMWKATCRWCICQCIFWYFACCVKGHFSCSKIRSQLSTQTIWNFIWKYGYSCTHFYCMNSTLSFHHDQHFWIVSLFAWLS